MTVWILSFEQNNILFSMELVMIHLYKISLFYQYLEPCSIIWMYWKLGEPRMCTSAAMVGARLNLGARRDPQGVWYLIRHFLLMPPRGYPHIEMTHSTKLAGPTGSALLNEAFPVAGALIQRWLTSIKLNPFNIPFDFTT